MVPSSLKSRCHQERQHPTGSANSLRGTQVLRNEVESRLRTLRDDEAIFEMCVAKLSHRVVYKKSGADKAF